MLTEAEDSFEDYSEEHLRSSRQLRLAEAALKRRLIAFFQCVEREMPESCGQYLVSVLSAMHSLERNLTISLQEPEPLQICQRNTLWTTVESIFQATIQTHFHDLARDRISALKATRGSLDRKSASGEAGFSETLEALEDCFMLSEWDLDCLQTVQQAIRDTIQEAAAAGLKQIMEMYMVSTTEVIEDTGA